MEVWGGVYECKGCVNKISGTYKQVRGGEYGWKEGGGSGNSRFLKMLILH